MVKRSAASLLVTGGAGFIGLNFVQRWLAEHPGDRLVVLDALTYAGNPGEMEKLEDREGFEFVHGDVCETEWVEELLRPNSVV